MTHLIHGQYLCRHCGHNLFEIFFNPWSEHEKNPNYILNRNHLEIVCQECDVGRLFLWDLEKTLEVDPKNLDFFKIREVKK